MVIRTWDSCQIPDGSLQRTSWLKTVKKNLGLFYFIFVRNHSRGSTGYIRQVMLNIYCLFAAFGYTKT